VTIISELHGETGFGENVREFITAGGIYALVDIATTGWPADGRVADSQHLYDQVVDDKEDDEVGFFAVNVSSCWHRERFGGCNCGNDRDTLCTKYVGHVDFKLAKEYHEDSAVQAAKRIRSCPGVNG
jgi:hypothetical protein